jgi:hypothetical protein
MMLPLMLAIATGAGEPARESIAAAVLGSQGTVCLATGYCTTPGPVPGEALPGGLMYLLLGVIGTGVAVLRSERRERPATP